MSISRRTHLVLPCLLVVASVIGAKPAVGFAPEVAVAIAQRVTEALPPAAHWNPDWNDATAFGIEARYEREDEDAEATGPAHRYVAGRTVPDPALDDPSGSGRVVGWAPRAVHDAAGALREAIELEHAGAIAQAVARLAISAADLADPFMMSAPEVPEVGSVRARFTDLVPEVQLAGLVALPTYALDDVLETALGFAGESASLRATVEAAAADGDEQLFASLRRDRIEAALTLAQSIAVHAWFAAGSPSLEHAAPKVGIADVWPSPARGAARIAFTLPAAGTTEVEVFDVSGRRVWRDALGRLPAGPHEVLMEERTSRLLPAGLFLVRVRTADYEALGRMLRLRD